MNIRFWALLGGVACVFSAMVFGQWILSDSAFSPVVLTATDEISGRALITIRIVEFLSTSIAVGALYFYLVRPWLKYRKWELEGLLLVGALVSYVLDTTINYYDYLMAWNKHAINFGTWGSFFPGHSGPTEYAEALYWGPPMYIYFGVALAGIQSWVIDRLRTVGLKSSLVLFCSAFLAAFVFDLVVESTLVRLEIYAWPNTIGMFTLWAGKTYQFPLYESLMVAIYASMYTFLLRNRDEYGYSFIERGAHGYSGSSQTFMRFLAATGFAFICTAIYFAGFDLISLRADSSVVLPSYLMFNDIR